MTKHLKGDYTGISFKGMDLSKATLDGNFTGADFIGATLKGADFSRSNLQDADLTGTDVSSVDTSKASLLNTAFPKTSTSR